MGEGAAGYREATQESLAKRRAEVAAERARYARAWRRCRAAKWVVVAGCVIWFAVAATAIFFRPIVAPLGSKAPDWSVFVLAVPVVVGGLMRSFFLCPRCRHTYNAFHLSGLAGFADFARCASCGLPYGSPCDPDRPDD